MDATDIIADMKVATGWNDISLVNETIVMRFDISDMKVISGLEQGKENMYLDFEDFKECPISFVVTMGDAVHQYWTLGDKLHRVNDLPA